MSRRSEERIIDGSLGRAEDLQVDFTQFGGIVVSEYPVPVCHQRGQHLSLILCKVTQRDKDESHEVWRNRNRPGMLVLEPIVGSLHRLFWREFCLFFFWKSSNESSDLSIVWVRDRDVSVVPRFLHSVDRELEPGNPTKHVSIPTVHVHELLEAVEKNVRCSLHEERPQEALEILHSVGRILQAISVQKPLVDCSFTFKTVSQCRSTLVSI